MTKALLLAILSLPLLGTAMVPAVRSQEASPETCMAIVPPLQRLACYDALFDPEAAAWQPAPGWQVTTSNSPISGRTNVTVSVTSNESVSADYGDPAPATLELRCDENVTTAMFSFGANYMSELARYADVSYRLDGAPMRAFRGRVSPDNRFIGLIDGATAIPFIRQLFGGSALLVRANPVSKDGRPLTVSFNTTGVEEAIAPLRAACAW